LGTDDTRRAVKGPMYRIADASSLSLKPGDGHRVSSLSLKRSLNALPGYQFLLEHSHLVQLMRNVVLRQIRPGLSFSNGEVTSAALRAILPDDPGLAKQKALFRHIARWCETHRAMMLVAATW